MWAADDGMAGKGQGASADGLPITAHPCLDCDLGQGSTSLKSCFLTGITGIIMVSHHIVNQVVHDLKKTSGA